jgi:hypothetical protein
MVVHLLPKQETRVRFPHFAPLYKCYNNNQTMAAENTPKQYFHDHLIMLLLSINAFLAIASSVFVLVRLNASHGTSYIVQYRPSLGADAFQTGSVLDLFSFIAFAVVILVIHSILSYRAYPIHRQLSITILSLGLLLLALVAIVGNALLTLR